MTLAFERCCVTRYNLQRFVWELYGSRSRTSHLHNVINSSHFALGPPVVYFVTFFSDRSQTWNLVNRAFISLVCFLGLVCQKLVKLEQVYFTKQAN